MVATCVVVYAPFFAFLPKEITLDDHGDDVHQQALTGCQCFFNGWLPTSSGFGQQQQHRVRQLFKWPKRTKHFYGFVVNNKQQRLVHQRWTN